MQPGKKADKSSIAFFNYVCVTLFDGKFIQLAQVLLLAKPESFQ